MPRYLLVNYKQAYINSTATLRNPSLRISKNSDCYFVCFRLDTIISKFHLL